MSVRVRTHELSFCYPAGRAAVSSVQLEASVGDVIGVIGPNGSGKSTLLRLLAGTLRPTSGRIERKLDGHTARDIAVVLDRLPFVDSLSGRENVETALALRGRRGRDARAAATQSLETFGLADRAQEPVAAYSMGMRRRLALAEAFAARPLLLLFDEPTLGLDPEGSSTLASALRAAAAYGVTAILTSNDADFVSTACDSVLMLHRGVTVAQGQPAELVAGLGLPTVIEVDVDAPPTRGPDRRGPELPSGLELLGLHGRTLRLATNRGSAMLTVICAWLEAEGHAVRAIRIQAPRLGDVFMRVTGVALEAAPAAPRAGEQTEAQAGEQRAEVP